MTYDKDRTMVIDMKPHAWHDIVWLLSFAATILLAASNAFGQQVLEGPAKAIAIAPSALFAQPPASPAATTSPNAAPLAFDAISIRPSKTTTTITSGGIEIERMFTRTTPDGYSVENTTLKYLIMEAYSVKWDSIVGGPGWIGSDTSTSTPRSLPPPTLLRPSSPTPSAGK